MPKRMILSSVESTGLRTISPIVPKQIGGSLNDRKKTPYHICIPKGQYTNQNQVVIRNFSRGMVISNRAP